MHPNRFRCRSPPWLRDAQDHASAQGEINDFTQLNAINAALIAWDEYNQLRLIHGISTSQATGSHTSHRQFLMAIIKPSTICSTSHHSRYTNAAAPIQAAAHTSA